MLFLGPEVLEEDLVLLIRRGTIFPESDSFLGELVRNLWGLRVHWIQERACRGLGLNPYLIAADGRIPPRHNLRIDFHLCESGGAMAGFPSHSCLILDFIFKRFIKRWPCLVAFLEPLGAGEGLRDHGGIFHLLPLLTYSATC